MIIIIIIIIIQSLSLSLSLERLHESICMVTNRKKEIQFNF